MFTCNMLQAIVSPQKAEPVDEERVLAVSVDSAYEASPVHSKAAKRIIVSARWTMTPEQLASYEEYRFNECHGGC